MSTYSSFLLRCWRNRHESPATFAIEHVQSGEQFRATTLGEVIAWIESNHERLTSANAESANPEPANPKEDPQ